MNVRGCCVGLCFCGVVIKLKLNFDLNFSSTFAFVKRVTELQAYIYNKV